MSDGTHSTDQGLATSARSGLPGTAAPSDEAVGYLRSLEHVELSVYFAHIRSPRVREEILALLGSLVSGNVDESQL